MAIKLVTKSGGISLTTGGVPQSEINKLLEAQEQRLEAEYADQIEGLETEINTLEATNKELNTENDALETQVETLSTEKEELTIEVGALNTTIEGLENEVDTLEATNKELSAENDGLESQIETLNTEKEELNNEIGTLNTEIGTLNTTIDGLEAEIVELEEDVEFYKQAAPPDEAFVITGNCYYRFSYGGWDWFINAFGKKITSDNITDGSYMFYNTGVKEIPFEINFKDLGGVSVPSMFMGCENLETVPKINNCRVGNMTTIFRGCQRLRYFPDDIEDYFNWAGMDTSTSAYGFSRQGQFQECRSLRSIPHGFLAHGNPVATYSYSIFYNGFYGCYALDEIVDMAIPYTTTWTSNAFYATFDNCYRLKNITFAMPDGKPYVVKWKSQVMDLSKYVGYAQNSSSVLNFNAGITEDKKIGYYYGEPNYEELKNDPDAWTLQPEFSRYNHDSAVATINSLPDTSAYLASAGGTNTIKFKKGSGSATDGGAVGNLTEAEIAVAAAKGWTVTLVN